MSSPCAPIRALCPKAASPRRTAGFSLAELLATLLVMTLLATIIAAGMPVAADAYTRTVSTARAQTALSTTAEALRAGLGTASKVLDPDATDAIAGTLAYRDVDGLMYRVANAADETHDGLTTQLMVLDANSHVIDSEEEPHPLIPDAAIADGLHVTLENAAGEAGGAGCVEVRDDCVVLRRLVVRDAADNEVAAIDDYTIMTRFADVAVELDGLGSQ